MYTEGDMGIMKDSLPQLNVQIGTGVGINTGAADYPPIAGEFGKGVIDPPTAEELAVGERGRVGDPPAAGEGVRTGDPPAVGEHMKGVNYPPTAEEFDERVGDHPAVG